MGFNCGIVGLPNVGNQRSLTLYGHSRGASGHSPSAQLSPMSPRQRPDPRLDALANIAGSQNIVPAQLEFVDIAALWGASRKGLGNNSLPISARPTRLFTSCAALR